MMIRVERGKGGAGRDTALSPALLETHGINHRRFERQSSILRNPVPPKATATSLLEAFDHISTRRCTVANSSLCSRKSGHWHQLRWALTPADPLNTSPSFASAALASGHWAGHPQVAVWVAAAFCSRCFLSELKQRPSCAVEDTLPNGISRVLPVCNHCFAHGTWNHALDRR
jgi:hypothetical protein